MLKAIELEDLQERIIDIARNERHALLVIPMGVFLVSAGLIIGVIGEGSFSPIGAIVVILLGVFSTASGFIITAHYAHKYNSLLRELDRVLFVRRSE